MKTNKLFKIGIVTLVSCLTISTFANNYADELKKRNFEFEEVSKMLQSKSFAGYMNDQKKAMNVAVDQSQKTGKGLGLNIPNQYFESGSNTNFLTQANLKQDQIAKSGITAPIAFVSFSMPDEDIRNLINEMAKVKGGVVIRGLVDDDFKKTVAKVASLKTKDGMGLMIDPTLFQLFDVKQVPSYVIPMQTIEPCVDKNKSCKQPKHIKATGAVSFRYMVDLVERTGTPEEKTFAAKYSAMLKGR
ncbi:type-F conjugative transfer system pilin assembly protein TrbC [Acinetobacter baumannii]|uniref:type-F conjugative transfer system pilin assembly protein TrbC n=1 Tax=Acinetobacter baumannii TaxID=470 RepID=UPI00385876A6